MPDRDHGQADRNAQHQQNEQHQQTADPDDLALGHRARTPRRVLAGIGGSHQRPKRQRDQSRQIERPLRPAEHARDGVIGTGLGHADHHPVEQEQDQHGHADQRDRVDRALDRTRHALDQQVDRDMAAPQLAIGEQHEDRGADRQPHEVLIAGKGMDRGAEAAGHHVGGEGADVERGGANDQQQAHAAQKRPPQHDPLKGLTQGRLQTVVRRPLSARSRRRPRPGARACATARPR